MKYLIVSLILLVAGCGATAQQNVGIGTTAPDPKSILQLSSTTQGFLPPVMNNSQMNAITVPPQGLMIYNNQTQSPMVYAQKGYIFNLLSGNYVASYGWQPVSTGPRMIAWGSVDSNGTTSFTDVQTGAIRIKSGSGNFTVSWDGNNRWFELSLNNMDYSRDSMLLIVTPVGNGSHDRLVSTSELLETSYNKATIKFVDISRLIENHGALYSRTRSEFHFVLYSLKQDPF